MIPGYGRLLTLFQHFGGIEFTSVAAALYMRFEVDPIFRFIEARVHPPMAGLADHVFRRRQPFVGP